MSAKKNQNPLYVVTNQGKDVEQAFGLVDLMIKRLGLGPVIDTVSSILEMIIQLILSQVNSYSLLVEAQQFLSRIIYEYEFFMARLGLGPVVEKKY